MQGSCDSFTDSISGWCKQQASQPKYIDYDCNNRLTGCYQKDKWKVVVCSLPNQDESS